MNRHSIAGSFLDACRGVGYVFRSQRNARIELAAAALVTILAIALRLPADQSALLAITVGMVFAAEAANTAIETVVDIVSPHLSEQARIAKDAAAGAVLLACAASLIVAACIFIPALINA